MEKRKVLLMILDGWGIGDRKKDDAIWVAQPEYMTSLEQSYPHAQLRTDGENVGLPDGQMGNSEVGHLNIGAGRVVYQDLVKINRACADGSIMQNPEIVKAFEYAAGNGKAVHLMGLVSDGGVHSSLDHLLKLCDVAKAFNISETFVHCFMDGRDTDPKSGKGFLETLAAHMQTTGSTGRIASVCGRYYAMDRDRRWERVKLAYDMLVSGVGEKATEESVVAENGTASVCEAQAVRPGRDARSPQTAPSETASGILAAVQKSYDEGVTDEFIKPIVAVDAYGNHIGTIREDDMVIFFNFRNDRAKELTEVLTQENMPDCGMRTIPLYFCTMTPYDDKFRGLHILFDKDNVENPIGEYISSLGMNQLRIAETEKYAHVTFFLNGGREEKFPGEERILVPSPKVDTYDLKPEMSAYEVADKLVEALDTQKFDFVALNFANGDMVGHTGIFPAVIQAVKAVDECVRKVVECAKRNGYEVLIMADHGNADHEINADGSPNTAHSLNPVPFIVVSDRVRSVANGVLADVAPSILQLMGLPKPKEMTGKELLTMK